MIETWGFREDIKGTGPNSVDLVEPDSVLKSVSQLWDLIETWGFLEDIKGTGPNSVNLVGPVDLADSVLNSVYQLWD